MAQKNLGKQNFAVLYLFSDIYLVYRNHRTTVNKVYLVEDPRKVNLDINHINTVLIVSDQMLCGVCLEVTKGQEHLL